METVVAPAEALAEVTAVTGPFTVENVTYWLALMFAGKEVTDSDVAPMLAPELNVINSVGVVKRKGRLTERVLPLTLVRAGLSSVTELDEL